jgi:hypothetical protein
MSLSFGNFTKFIQLELKQYEESTAFYIFSDNPNQDKPRRVGISHKNQTGIPAHAGLIHQNKHSAFIGIVHVILQGKAKSMIQISFSPFRRREFLF